MQGRNLHSCIWDFGKGALSELRFCGVVVLQCCGRLASGPLFLIRSLPGFPGANIKEFWLTILSEAKRPQRQCLSPQGEFLDLQ